MGFLCRVTGQLALHELGAACEERTLGAQASVPLERSTRGRGAEILK